MPDRLLFVSSNPGKVREVEAIVGAPIAQLDLDLPEIQALDVTEVARHKAQTAFEQVGRPVLVEDTGLYIDALGGLPGAFVRWFLATIGPAGICDLLPAGTARTAQARTVVALCAGDEVDVFRGETPGEITLAPEGDGGFGWDAIFRPDGSDHTFAQMDAGERARYSMRRLALEHLRDRIQTSDTPTPP
jgi:XTP/dITP diphosphohydrolase